MIKTNYHTHTKLCNHAEGMAIDYIKRAVECGYQEIGISDHGPLLDSWNHLRMDLDQFQNLYIKNIDEAIFKYSDQIKIYKGLELEYLKEYQDHYHQLLKNLDYLILGQHIIIQNDEIIDIYKGFDEEQMGIYRDMVIEGMATNYFKILAHPDLFLFKKQPWTPYIEKISRDIIEASIKHQVFLEINVNGMRRGTFHNQDGEITYIYPRLEFWKLVSEYPNALIIINEDNHALRYVDDSFCQEARVFANKLNLKVSKYLFGEKNE